MLGCRLWGWILYKVHYQVQLYQLPPQMLFCWCYHLQSLLNILIWQHFLQLSRPDLHQIFSITSFISSLLSSYLWWPGQCWRRGGQPPTMADTIWCSWCWHPWGWLLTPVSSLLEISYTSVGSVQVILQLHIEHMPEKYTSQLLQFKSYHNTCNSSSFTI